MNDLDFYIYVPDFLEYLLSYAITDDDRKFNEKVKYAIKTYANSTLTVKK